MAKASSTRRATSPEVFRIWSASSSGNSIMTCIVGTPDLIVGLDAAFCLLTSHSVGMDMLPWHGRGREFESHQVHENKAQQNIDLRKCLRTSTSRKSSRRVHLESRLTKIWTQAGARQIEAFK